MAFCLFTFVITFIKIIPLFSSMTTAATIFILTAIVHTASILGTTAILTAHCRTWALATRLWTMTAASCARTIRVLISGITTWTTTPSILIYHNSLSIAFVAVTFSCIHLLPPLIAEIINLTLLYATYIFCS